MLYWYVYPIRDVITVIEGAEEYKLRRIGIELQDDSERLKNKTDWYMHHQSYVTSNPKFKTT